MNFIDRTGHIFNLTSYDEYPIGYEYEETPYIFYFETERGSKLSVNNYYFRPVRIVTKVKQGDEVCIDIKIENSAKFYLINSDVIEDKLLNIDSINDSIKLFENSITQSQHLHYTESIRLNEQGSKPFKGCVVDESDPDVRLGTEIYYTNAFSNKEYTGTIYHKADLEIGTTYLNEEGSDIVITEETDNDMLFGQITIGELSKYIKLNQLTREVLVTDENESSLSNIHIKEDLYLINTFYVVVNSAEQGVWSTNVLINVDDEYCPITVCAEIIDEQEELIINGQNIGVKLPKEIVQAIYSGNYNVSIADEKTYYNKMKEYLMNYMLLKGEMGNYRSAINSLKWFEWGDKLTISRLMRNDNRIQRQYVKDFFDLINDNIYSYKLFKDTALLSIELQLNEDKEAELQIQGKQTGFIGEGKPRIEKLFDSLKEVKYEEEEYAYVRGYFDFTFNDLGLKLAALKYYYEKYFLPLYIRIHKVYMNNHVYANDIKLINKTSHGITANPIFITNDTVITDEETNEIKEVLINNGSSIVYFNRYYKKDNSKPYITYDDEGNPIEYNLLYIDENYNEFTHYTNDYVEASEDMFYEVNETCLKIPISLPHKEGGYEYYNVTLMLSRYINKNNESILDNEESNLFELLNNKFSFIQTDDKLYEGIVLYPKIINESVQNNFDVMYWLNNRFRIDLIINNKPYVYTFTTKMPEFNIEMGTLEYKYDSKFKQLSEINGDNIKFNACMYLPNLVNVNNISFDEEIIQLSYNIRGYINSNYKEHIKFLNKKYLNACHLLDLTDTNGNSIPYDIPDNNIEVMTWNDLSLFASASQNTTLYRNFFNDDGTYKFDESLLYINKHSYDFYLMHDYKQWYVILISKEPVDYTSEKEKKFKFSTGSNTVKIGNYLLTYSRSDRKFLINRYTYKPSEGNNHFNSEDLIVASLKNNDKLCFKLSLGSKWNILPLSLGMKNVNPVTSNTELAIISIPDKFAKYEKGYYSLSIEYCIDDYANHIYTNKTQFRIDG